MSGYIGRGDIFAQFEKLRAAVAKFAGENDFCIVCENHPSRGHSKTCPLYEEADRAPARGGDET